MKAHTHTQIIVNHRFITTSVLLFVFTLMASLQAKSQNALNLGNKSACDYFVEVTFCSGGGTSVTVAAGTQNLIGISGQIAYYKVFFAPNISTPDIVVYPALPTPVCDPGSSSGTNPCGNGWSESYNGSLGHYNFSANN